MVISFKRKLFLRIAEVYFADDYIDNIPKCDVTIYFYTPKYRDGCKKIYTLHIDLSKIIEQLFSEIRYSTKRKIKQAEKERLQVFLNNEPTDEDIKEFSDFYNIFAKSKNLSKCSISKLKALREVNALVISVIKDEFNNPLCYHASIVDGIRVTGLYSASHHMLPSQEDNRNLIGKANRYLDWFQIKYFKERGYSIYDFGGLSLNEKDKALQNIDNYKRGFGGEVVLLYKYYTTNSLLGKVYHMRYIIIKIKNFFMQFKGKFL